MACFPAHSFRLSYRGRGVWDIFQISLFFFANGLQKCLADGNWAWPTLVQLFVSVLSRPKAHLAASATRGHKLPTSAALTSALLNLKHYKSTVCTEESGGYASLHLQFWGSLLCNITQLSNIMNIEQLGKLTEECMSCHLYLHYRLHTMI